MCIVTRAVRDEGELLRFVLSPDGDVVPDLARKLPGRGVWVTVEKGQVEAAVARGLFARGFHAPAKASADLPQRVGQLLRQQVVSHLSLARKAGEAVAGFMKVEEALKRGPVGLLLHASGAAEEGIRKLDRLARPETVVSGILASGDLDLAFGRTNVVHAAVADGGLATRLVFHVARLARYEGFAIRAQGSEDKR